jgi:hypothetical protein
MSAAGEAGAEMRQITRATPLKRQLARLPGPLFLTVKLVNSGGLASAHSLLQRLATHLAARVLLACGAFPGTGPERW